MGLTKNVTLLVVRTIAAPAIQPLKAASASIGTPSLTFHKETPPLSKAAVTASHTAAVQVHGGVSGSPGVDMRFKATGEIYEDQIVTSMARIMLPSVGPIQQANVSSDISLEVYNITSEDPDVAIAATTTTTATASIYNALQTDTRWTVDTVGYNFKHSYTPDEGLLEGGNTYRFEYKITTSDDGILFVITEVAVRSVYSV